MFMTRNSTRLFVRRFAVDVFGTSGSVSPYPVIQKFFAFSIGKVLNRYWSTARARIWESGIRYPGSG